MEEAAAAAALRIKVRAECDAARYARTDRGDHASLIRVNGDHVTTTTDERSVRDLPQGGWVTVHLVKTQISVESPLMSLHCTQSVAVKKSLS